MSDQIKRYNACATEFCIDFIEREDGEVVKYTDHAATVAKLQQQIAELQAERVEIARRTLKAARIACEAEAISDGTGEPEDEAYNSAISDCASRIRSIDPQSIVGGE